MGVFSHRGLKPSLSFSKFRRKKIRLFLAVIAASLQSVLKWNTDLTWLNQKLHPESFEEKNSWIVHIHEIFNHNCNKTNSFTFLFRKELRSTKKVHDEKAESACDRVLTGNHK